MADSSQQTTTFILGAGFSKNSGLPLQSDFASLLFANSFRSDLDIEITKIIKQFLKTVFGWEENSPLPSFEDIFTCIDLSVRTNHNLGIKYDAEDLRSIRKMMIYRIFSMLDQRFTISNEITQLLQFFINPEAEEKCNFVVLNWDIVLEKHLMHLNSQTKIDYCCSCYDWNEPVMNKHSGIPICKMHGSSNWIYCKNCKSLFFDLFQKLSLITKAGLEKSDIRRFNSKFTKKRFYRAIGMTAQQRECKMCHNMPSPHIATFSYIKSFDTRIYSSIWDRAEKLLADSTRWVFIGYSFPEADY
jgi:hypothetical protein